MQSVQTLRLNTIFVATSSILCQRRQAGEETAVLLLEMTQHRLTGGYTCSVTAFGHSKGVQEVTAGQPPTNFVHNLTCCIYLQATCHLYAAKPLTAAAGTY